MGLKTEPSYKSDGTRKSSRAKPKSWRKTYMDISEDGTISKGNVNIPSYADVTYAYGVIETAYQTKYQDNTIINSISSPEANMFINVAHGDMYLNHLASTLPIPTTLPHGLDVPENETSKRNEKNPLDTSNIAATICHESMHILGVGDAYGTSKGGTRKGTSGPSTEVSYYLETTTKDEDGNIIKTSEDEFIAHGGASIMNNHTGGIRAVEAAKLHAALSTQNWQSYFYPEHVRNDTEIVSADNEGLLEGIYDVNKPQQVDKKGVAIVTDPPKDESTPQQTDQKGGSVPADKPKPTK